MRSRSNIHYGHSLEPTSFLGTEGNNILRTGYTVDRVTNNEIRSHVILLYNVFIRSGALKTVRT